MTLTGIAPGVDEGDHFIMIQSARDVDGRFPAGEMCRWQKCVACSWTKSDVSLRRGGQVIERVW